MGLLSKIFGDYSTKEVKKIQPLKEKVLSLEDEYSRLSEDELKGKTNEFKERLNKGETLDDILPEAFATVREASWRVLGMKHFPVQIIGGIILHQGRIAEMKTGEGKTLVATLPAYLNALTGKGANRGEEKSPEPSPSSRSKRPGSSSKSRMTPSSARAERIF